MPNSRKNGNHKYSLHNSSNRNGEHLTDVTKDNRFTCLNTNFQKREGKLWTYIYANNTKTLIDYVFINKKWKNSAVNCEALNCEVYSSFVGMSSDCNIMAEGFRFIYLAFGFS